MFIFPEENNTVIPPVSFSPAFPFPHFEGYRYSRKIQSNAMQKTKRMNVILYDEKENNNLLIAIYLWLKSGSSW